MKTITQLLIIALTCASHSALADLKDPTQAPAIVDSSSGNETTAQAPRLQSVMLSAQYRAAIINGQKVLLGKKYEQATLIKLSENSATLRNEDGSTQTLMMDYADMKKIPAASEPSTQRKTAKHPTKNTTYTQSK